MAIFPEVDQQRRAFAAGLDPKIVAKLPHRPLRYGATHLALDSERMLLARGIVDFHLGKYAGDAVTFYKERYVDCYDCVEVRLSIFSEHKEVPSYDYLCRELERQCDLEHYWCNTCQGTGWNLEDLADLIKRLNIVTWADKAAALSASALQAALLDDAPRHPRRRHMPDAVLKAEAARRLALCAA